MMKMRSIRLWSLLFMITIALAFRPVQAWAAIAEISWDANTDPELSGYKVHYGTASGSYQNIIDAGKSTIIELDGLNPGQTYYFAVTACFNSYETEYSDEVSISIPTAADISQASDGSTGGGGGGCFIQTATFS
jgi:hypothetical protein